MSLLLILLAGLSDRMRGSGWFGYSHLTGMFLLGVVVSVLLGVHGWVFGYVVVSVMLGAAPGWGNPLGAAFSGTDMKTDYEWWQVGKLQESVLLAVLFRGAMWGILLAPVSLVACFAFVFAFTVSPYLARLIPYAGDKWALMEFMRGMIVAGVIAYV